MANIALVTTEIAAAWPHWAEIYSVILSETMTPGQAAYFIASSTGAGKVAPTDASSAGTALFAGIVLEGGGAGQSVSLLKRGHIEGYTVTSLNYFVPLYLSDDAGLLADGAGSTSKIVGRVVPVTDHALTKLVYIEALWN